MSNLREKYPNDYQRGKQEATQLIQRLMPDRKRISKIAMDEHKELERIKNLLEKGVHPDGTPYNEKTTMIFESNVAYFEGRLSCFD